MLRILRAGCDAIAVGAGTAVAENYGPVNVPTSLAALRSAAGSESVPPVVVVTRSGNLHPASRLFTDPPHAIVLTCRSGEVNVESSEVAEVLVCGEEQVDLRAGIDALRQRGMRRILCEGGLRLLNSMFRADLVDELCATATPVLLGPPRPELTGTDLPTGSEWETSPLPLALAGVLEEAGTLLCRWVVDSNGRRQRATNAALR